jgi:predicted DNA-binding protein
MARPPRAEAPARAVSIKLSPYERWRLERLAKATGQTVSAFLREAIETAAADLDDEPETDQAASRARTRSR